MDLLDKYKDKLPKFEGEPIMDGLIEKAEKTEEYVDHDKVKDRVPEEQEKISAAVGSMLPVMKTMNKASAFIDKNEDVKEALEETEGIFDQVNKLLKKLISMNCLNEICIKAKLYKKIYEISQQIEEEQGKVLTCREAREDGRGHREGSEEVHQQAPHGWRHGRGQEDAEGRHGQSQGLLRLIFDNRSHCLQSFVLLPLLGTFLLVRSEQPSRGADRA